MTTKNAIKIFLLLFIVQGANAVERKDASLRDEDISNTIISVDVQQRDDGLYEYIYTVESINNNKGNISRIFITLSCDASFEPVSLPSSNGKPGYLGDVQAVTGSYTPAAIQADYGAASSFGLTVNHEALWGTRILPGQKRVGLRLISPAAPGMRSYLILPWLHYDERYWILPEDGSPVPSARDFAITGMVAGPGCPGVTEPPETALYPGTGYRVEPDNINALLRYRTPQKDRFHVPVGTKETTLHIFYDKSIDAKTFKVQPAWLKHYFNPIAGTNEQVTLPLKKARNKIKLSVHTIKATGTTRKENKSHHSYKDTDVFEIRIDAK